MARASNIYVVTGVEDDVIAVFTTKYELVNFLRRRRHDPYFRSWIVARWRDGTTWRGDVVPPVELDVNQLIGDLDENSRGTGS
jgi:hypothetical protein